MKTHLRRFFIKLTCIITLSLLAFSCARESSVFLYDTAYSNIHEALVAEKALKEAGFSGEAKTFKQNGTESQLAQLLTYLQVNKPKTAVVSPFFAREVKIFASQFPEINFIFMNSPLETEHKNIFSCKSDAESAWEKAGFLAGAWVKDYMQKNQDTVVVSAIFSDSFVDSEKKQQPFLRGFTQNAEEKHLLIQNVSQETSDEELDIFARELFSSNIQMIFLSETEANARLFTYIPKNCLTIAEAVLDKTKVPANIIALIEPDFKTMAEKLLLSKKNKDSKTVLVDKKLVFTKNSEKIRIGTEKIDDFAEKIRLSE